MTSYQQTLLTLAVLATAFGAAYGWFSDKSRKLKEDEFNRDLRAELSAQRTLLEEQAKARESELDVRRQEIQAREKFVTSMHTAFGEGFTRGRNWLARYIAESEQAFDEYIAQQLRSKKRPALKAAEEVTLARAERRQAKERVKQLEYQLQSLKEYFPFIEEYEDIILDEAVPLLAGQSNLDTLDEADPVLHYVAKADFDRMSASQRNQLALDRYLAGTLSPTAIGRLYERYLGFLYETDGWNVEYHGIVKGFEDLGRDLICLRENEVRIVQAKCWAAHKTIHEKHIFQLFGTTQLYLMNHRASELFEPQVQPVFVTTTTLSPVARQAAEWLNIQVEERKALSKAFPMIKCNVNQETKARIYHLPFDQQYDRTHIIPELGERYATTVAEAEAAGFRRAFRFSGVGLRAHQ